MSRWMLATALLAYASSLWGQAEYRVYNDHPRLWLDEARLKRLSRDAERETGRWLRLQQLLAQNAVEQRTAALALRYRAAGDEAAGRQAIESALRPDNDLRQRALVYDWCQDLLDPPSRESLLNLLAAGVQDAVQRSGLDLAGVRDGVLAAIAVSGDWDGAEGALGEFFEQQWKTEILPALLAGEFTREGADLVALLEITHAVRANLERDLWSQAPDVFRSLALPRILSYTGDSVETAEGRLRLSALLPASEDRDREAALWRAAEIMAVAYDTSSRDFQFLQGWLRNDSYTLTGPLGSFYEFLWLNPYLPGLSPTSGPKLAYDAAHSRIFARRGWEAEDVWIGYYDGRLILRADGEEHQIRPADQQAPLVFGSSALLVAEPSSKFTVKLEDDHGAYPSYFYFVALDPARRYEVRVNKYDWEAFEPSPAGVIVVRNVGDKSTAGVDLSKPVRLQFRDAGPRSTGPRPTLGP